MSVINKFRDFRSFLSWAGGPEAEGRALRIGCVNWPLQFPDRPYVDVATGHDGQNIFLRFRVSEKYTLARVTETNGPVWTDSCVEFFISFDQAGYYNFEMTSIGTTLLGFRKERENPTHAPAAVIGAIERIPSIGTEPFEEKLDGQKWELAVRIPLSSFFKHRIDNLSGMEAKANFFKCGDALSVPHFLSWQPIVSVRPDFHLEKFFGTVVFE